jgi:hypothetical protein
LAWKPSIPISSGVCMFQPGSVKSGGTWQVTHLPLSLPSNTVLPRAAAALKLPSGGCGAGMASW